MPDVMTDKFMLKYGRSGNCGDDVAEALAMAVTDGTSGRFNEMKYRQVADDNMVAIDKWGHLNNGQRRMLLGNVLRGKIRRGGTVKINGGVFQE